MTDNSIMIGRLTGLLVEDSGDGDIVLDVHGVGYELTVPNGTLGRVGLGEDSVLTLFVHTHVREDAFVLYGFSSKTERMAFRTLLGVSSIGPRLALSILSVLPARELAKAVQQRDAQALVAVPGVGKKSAERVLLELRDKLGFAFTPTPSETGEGPEAKETSGPVVQQVVEALTRMGFRPSEAERAISLLEKSVENRSIQEVFREALSLLRP